MGDSLEHLMTSRRMPETGRRCIAVASELPETWSWPALFGNDRPVELEIGVGKGTFLLNRARAHPERNFFGIEWANEFYRYAVDRMERWRAPNVRLLRTDASYFIRHVCPRGSVAVIHIYHPDPWPKRRHHKRRLFQPQFVDAAAECLVPGGLLRLQTDHAEYFSWIRPMLTGHPLFEETPFGQAGIALADRHDERNEATVTPGREPETALGTNFETKYLREGRSIYRLAVRRAEAAAK